MPEGDTVYATAHRLNAALGGVTLVRGELRHPRLSTVDLAGRVLVTVATVGKHLFLRFDRELTLHCHLMLDGSWRVFDQSRRAPVNHRTRAILASASHVALGQSLHQMALVATADEHRLVSHLGPDLLSPSWDDSLAAEAVRRLGRDPGRALGEALLDQTVMAGVGNVYKTEVCFLLGVSPWTPVSDVDAGEVVELARRLLVRNALRPVRNTTGDRRRPLWVYGRRDCLRCGGVVVYGQQGDGLRTSPFCPACQVGPRG